MKLKDLHEAEDDLEPLIFCLHFSSPRITNMYHHTCSLGVFCVCEFHSVYLKLYLFVCVRGESPPPEVHMWRLDDNLHESIISLYLVDW